MLLTPMDVNKLATLSEQGLFIQVSLEGANAATHDPIRGAGSFARTVNGLTRLIKAGLSQQMCIAFTEMQHNFGEIPELLDMVVQMGIGRFVSGTLVESGRAANTPHIAPPTPAQYKWLLDVYHSDKTFREQYQQIGNISALEWQLDTTPMENPGCCRLIESPYITASGTFYPCVMLHAQAYAARDIFRHPLAEAIHDILPLWQELQQLGQCRVLEAEPCKDCSHAALCGAGCMGRAFALHGNLTAPEDRCQLRQAVYNWKPSSQMLRK
jgi:radical SAM protein with 4Fe4S-binding SPASM domain